MIIKGLMAIIILFIIPILLGFFILKFFKKENYNIFFSIVMGYILQFAICQIVAVPMIYANFSFTVLLYSYIIIISILSAISFVLNIKKFKQIWNENKQIIKSFPIGYMIITIVLIGLQVYGFVGYAHIDDDDAFYIGTATVSVQTDTLYQYSSTTGDKEIGDHLSARYRLAPFPMFVAIMSKAISIHPAIVAHVILPIIFVPLVYIIYGLIAEELFQKDKKNVFLFLIILCILHIWGNYSIRNNFTFLLFRIWQGKSVLVNMIIPMVILLFIKAEKEEFKLLNCLLLMITILAGDFTTTMGIGIPPLVLMILCLVYEILKINYKDIRNNNYKLIVSNILKCLIICIPSLIYGMIYLFS